MQTVVKNPKNQISFADALKAISETAQNYSEIILGGIKEKTDLFVITRDKYDGNLVMRSLQGFNRGNSWTYLPVYKSLEAMLTAWFNDGILDLYVFEDMKEYMTWAVSNWKD